MEPVVLPVDRSETTLRIRAANDPRLAGEHTLTIRATGHQPGDLRVVSEATVPFTTSK